MTAMNEINSRDVRLAVVTDRTNKQCHIFFLCGSAVLRCSLRGVVDPVPGRRNVTVRISAWAMDHSSMLLLIL